MKKSQFNPPSWATILSEANVAQEEPPDELGQALFDAQKDNETVKEALKFEKMLEDYRCKDSGPRRGRG